MKQFCLKVSQFAVPVGVGIALTVSNGPAVGLAVGIALAVVFASRRS